MKAKPLQIPGHTIRTDKIGLISLTDLWKASGRNQDAQPFEWLRTSVDANFISHVIEHYGKSSTGPNPLQSIPPKPEAKRGNKEAIRAWMKCIQNTLKQTILMKTTRGRGASTYAHWQISLAYAKYLSPALHIQVNEVYARYRSGDLTLADEMVDKASPEDQKKHLARTQSKVIRNHFTSVLGRHGVKGRGYADCTNAIYRPLLGGSAKEVRKARKLPVKANVRENMSLKELFATGLAEELARENIQENDIYGNDRCSLACEKASRRVGGVM